MEDVKNGKYIPLIGGDFAIYSEDFDLDPQQVATGFKDGVNLFVIDKASKTTINYLYAVGGFWISR